MNLDPDAENFKYLLAIDIRELISLEYVMRGAPREFGDKAGVPTEFQPSFRVKLLLLVLFRSLSGFS